jgi:hypothetical protein
MNKIIQYLKQPYPCSRNSWRTIVLISLFVSIFLIIFKPFGASNINQTARIWILAGYGGVTFIILIVNLIGVPLLFKKEFAESNWTLGRQILWLCWILFTIGLGNYFYSRTFFSLNISLLKGLLLMQFVTVSVGIFPIVLISIITYNRLLRKNLLQALDLDAQISMKSKNESTERRLLLYAENEKNNLDLTDNQLIYISSEGNYSTVYYKHESQIKKTVMRSTLKRMEDQVKINPNLFRCHRAFIVNMQHIEKINGNSQGLQLKLTGDFEVPVSRNFAKELKERIQQLN